MSPRPFKCWTGPLLSQKDAFTSTNAAVTKTSPAVEKQKPNFAPTGRLAAESNTVKSASGAAIILKYREPPESRKPSPAHQWRMYVFEDSQILDTVLLHERSCWLIGREAPLVRAADDVKGDMLPENCSHLMRRSVAARFYSVRQGWRPCCAKFRGPLRLVPPRLCWRVHVREPQSKAYMGLTLVCRHFQARYYRVEACHLDHH